jgi:hypothetical protein
MSRLCDARACISSSTLLNLKPTNEEDTENSELSDPSRGTTSTYREFSSPFYRTLNSVHLTVIFFRKFEFQQNTKDEYIKTISTAHRTKNFSRAISRRKRNYGVAKSNVVEIQRNIRTLASPSPTAYAALSFASPLVLPTAKPINFNKF